MGAVRVTVQAALGVWGLRVMAGSLRVRLSDWHDGTRLGLREGAQAANTNLPGGCTGAVDSDSESAAGVPVPGPPEPGGLSGPGGRVGVSCTVTAGARWRRHSDPWLLRMASSTPPGRGAGHLETRLRLGGAIFIQFFSALEGCLTFKNIVAHK